MSVESINNNVAAAVVNQPAALVQDNKQSDQKITDKVVTSVDSVAEPSESELNSAVDKLNDFVSNVAQRDLSFSIDKETNQMVVVVKDKLTQEVIRQMPTKEALAVAKQIESMLGLILNDKA